MRGDAGFDVDVVCLTKDKDLLDRARSVFDTAAQASVAAAKTKKKEAQAPAKTPHGGRRALVPFGYLCTLCARASGKARGKGKYQQQSFGKDAWGKSAGKQKSQGAPWRRY